MRQKNVRLRSSAGGSYLNRILIRRKEEADVIILKGFVLTNRATRTKGKAAALSCRERKNTRVSLETVKEAELVAETFILYVAVFFSPK